MTTFKYERDNELNRYERHVFPSDKENEKKPEYELWSTGNKELASRSNGNEEWLDEGGREGGRGGDGGVRHPGLKKIYRGKYNYVFAITRWPIYETANIKLNRFKCWSCLINKRELTRSKLDIEDQSPFDYVRLVGWLRVSLSSPIMLRSRESVVDQEKACFLDRSDG